MDTNDGKSATIRKTTELGLLKIPDLIPFYTEKRDLVKVDTRPFFIGSLAVGDLGTRLAYTRVYFLFAGTDIKHADRPKTKLNVARLAIIRQCADSFEANISANKISLPQGS